MMGQLTTHFLGRFLDWCDFRLKQLFGKRSHGMLLIDISNFPEELISLRMKFDWSFGKLQTSVNE